MDFELSFCFKIGYYSSSITSFCFKILTAKMSLVDYLDGFTSSFSSSISSIFSFTLSLIVHGFLSVFSSFLKFSILYLIDYYCSYFTSYFSSSGSFSPDYSFSTSSFKDSSFFFFLSFNYCFAFMARLLISILGYSSYF